MPITPSWTAVLCPAPSADHRRRAEERQAQLTKPAGSLGRLEQIAIELAPPSPCR